MNPNDVAPMIISSVLFVSAAIVFVLRGPVGKALARRLEGGAGGADLEARVHELETRLAQIEQDGGQVAELAERVDFAERLLAQSTRAIEDQAR